MLPRKFGFDDRRLVGLVARFRVFDEDLGDAVGGACGGATLVDPLAEGFGVDLEAGRGVFEILPLKADGGNVANPRALRSAAEKCGALSRR
jgi:hypothetical protein